MEATEQNVSAPASSTTEQPTNLMDPDYGAMVEVQTEAKEDFLGTELAEPNAPPASGPEAQPTQPTAAPAAPTEPTVPASPPVAAAPQAPAPVAPSQPAQPAAPAQSTEPTREQYESMLAEIDNALMKLYGFAPEAAGKLDDLGAKPSEYLPQFAANIHRNVYTQALQAVQELVPQMVAQHLQRKTVEDSAENAFFSRWPDLKGKDDVVLRSVKAFRVANPDVNDQAKIIEGAGVLAMMAAGLNPLGQTPAAPPSPPSTPGFTPPRPAMPGSVGPGSPGQGPQLSYEEQVFADMANNRYS